MSGVRVRFEPGGLVAEVAPGTTLHAAAAEAGVRLAAPCGGMGRCGSCRVRASGAVHPPDRSELEALGAAARAGARLACRARVDGPDEVVVEVPEQAGSIRTQMASVGPEPAVELPALRGVVTIPGVAALGAAVDLGTTTIAVRLHDLSDGRVLGEIAAMIPCLKKMPKLKIAADLIENISAITSDAARVGVTTMREALTGALLGEKEILLLRFMKDMGRLETRINLALADNKADVWEKSSHVRPGRARPVVSRGRPDRLRSGRGPRDRRSQRLPRAPWRANL